MLKLIGKITLIVLCALILSLGVDYFYRRTFKLTYQPPQNILPFPETREKYDLVALGNSHSESGITFERYKTKSLILASVAQSFEYDFAMLKMHSKEISKDAVIIINASPLSFSQKRPDRADLANMNYYDGRLSPFLIPSIKLDEYLQIQVVPFVRAGSLWREKYSDLLKQSAAEKLKAQEEKQSALALPTSATPIETEAVPANTSTFAVKQIKTEISSPSGVVDDGFIDSARRTADKWYNSGGFDTQSFAINRQDLKKIIAYSLEHHWRPVIITLPISQTLLDNLEPGYLKRYVYDNLDKMDLQDIDYFDFSSNTQLIKNRSLFGNADHLNAKGASVLSYLLLQKLIGKNYLPKETDGYDKAL